MQDRHRIRVKICGIRTAEAAKCAVENGADALGFVFYPKSPRDIAVEDAARLIAGLPPLVSKVGVFADASVDGIVETVRETGIDTVQLHGNETHYDLHFIQELRNRLKCPVLYAVRLRTLSAENLRELAARDVRLKDCVAGYLVDAEDAEAFGGTGRRVMLDIGNDPSSRDFLARRVILAGGLRPDNVGEILEAVTPYGLDVSSGVESEKGVKDPARIRDFLNAVRDFQNRDRAGAGSGKTEF